MIFMNYEKMPSFLPAIRLQFLTKMIRFNLEFRGNQADAVGARVFSVCGFTETPTDGIF